MRIQNAWFITIWSTTVRYMCTIRIRIRDPRVARVHPPRSGSRRGTGEVGFLYGNCARLPGNHTVPDYNRSENYIYIQQLFVHTHVRDQRARWRFVASFLETRGGGVFFFFWFFHRHSLMRIANDNNAIFVYKYE